MIDEAEKGFCFNNPNRNIERVSAGTGVSRRSITRIKKGAKRIYES